MRIFSRNNPQSRQFTVNSFKFAFLAVLFALVMFWLVCLVVILVEWKGNNTSLQTKTKLISKSKPATPDTTSNSLIAKNKNNYEESQRGEILEPVIVSRMGNVTVTSDVRGNLGPAQVVVQHHPGKDWIHDRWQAASNMHGKNIPGAHWILLDFGREIIPHHIVLDWEAAYSDQYRLEASLVVEPIKNAGENTAQGDDVWILFDAMDPSQSASRKVEKSGQSPGVKTKTPLHVIHTLNPLQSNRPLRYLRLYMLKSAMGWGVSLWQFDVYGFDKSKVIQ